MKYTIAELLGMKESLITEKDYTKKLHQHTCGWKAKELKVEYTDITFGKIIVPEIEEIKKNIVHLEESIEKISKLILEESIKLVDTL